MRTAPLLLLAAPLGYLLLNAYLFSKVMPLPIAIMPENAIDERQPASLAA